MKYSVLVVLSGLMLSGLTLAESSVKRGPECSKNNAKTSKECQQANSQKAPRKAKAPQTPVKSSQKMVKAAVKSDLIFNTQHQLNRLGFNAGPADGIMGKRTRNAIKAFQRSNHDHIDGKVSPALLEELKRAKKH